MRITDSGLLNLFLLLLVLLAAVVVTGIRMGHARREPLHEAEDPRARYGLDGLILFVRDRINSLTRTNLYELGLDQEEFRKRENKREELKRALRHCAHGSDADKRYVKDVMLDMLDAYLPDDMLHVAVPFHRPEQMSGPMVFACLLHFYRKEYGLAAFSVLVDRHALDRLRPLPQEEQAMGHVITEADIRRIYEEEGWVPKRSDKLEMLAQLVYERFKGLGVVDELRDMDIDGVSGGVSGVTEDAGLLRHGDDAPTELGLRACDSVWVFFRGKSIRLACTGFGSDKELRRVCQNIYRYNKAGQLSEANGYRVSEMHDGCRVVVVRPPFSESWAFFVRKFKIRNMSLETLITDTNAALPIPMIRYLAKGAMITALTGSQGSGKTTLLMEMIRHVDAAYPLRIQEMAFELHLRRLYPGRNILSFRETDTVSGQAGLDLQKKTDGSVNILGEVATDEVAAWMIQMAQVASLFTLFTHHAKTTEDLILNLRNALLKCEMFRDETVAEQQVVAVLDFDIHLARDVEGKRYIERITEIIETQRHAPYPAGWCAEADPVLAAVRFQETEQAFFERMTDRRTHETRNIIEYRDGAYHAVHRPSAAHVAEMAARMRPEDARAFDAWLNAWWPLDIADVRPGWEVLPDGREPDAVPVAD